MPSVFSARPSVSRSPSRSAIGQRLGGLRRRRRAAARGAPGRARGGPAPARARRSRRREAAPAPARTPPGPPRSRPRRARGRQAQALVQQRRAHGLGVGVDLGDRLPDQRDRARDLAGVVGGERRVLEHVDAVAARALGGVRHAVPQLQRALEVALGLAEREHALRAEARGHRRAERARDVVRRVPVAGELGGDGRRRDVAEQLGRLLERRGQPRVQVAALAGQQIAVDRLADERVAERVGVAGARHQHLVRDRLAQPVAQVGRVEIAQRRQQRRAASDARSRRRGRPPAPPRRAARRG